ncbi:MAG: substrate-binding domain-containing protein [Prochloraceae cyanobacterium]
MSKKVALLIGVSEYKLDLKPLPKAAEDVEGMAEVLQNRVEGFDRVKTLIDPDSLEMTEAIEILFSDCDKDDLALLYFSGHGIKDDRGKLYFATPITRKNSKGELVKATSVPANFVKEMMENSRSKQQVVILDCCFSGAFAEGMTAKDDDLVDVRAQLGGEGRAILTASTSSRYSFENRNSKLSIYTNYLVEGIQSGEADLDRDGIVTIGEWHEYASKKARSIQPAMKPEIYSFEEGLKIPIVKVALKENKQKYRQQVKKFIRGGEISLVGRKTLEIKQAQMGLSPNEAEAIELEVLQHYRQDYQEKLDKYEAALKEVIEQEENLSAETRKDLQDFQESLGVKEEDTIMIEARLTAARLIERNKQEHSMSLQAVSPKTQLPAKLDRPQIQSVYNPEASQKSDRQQKILTSVLVGGAIAAMGLLVSGLWWTSNNQTDRQNTDRQVATQTNKGEYTKDFSIAKTRVPSGQFNYGGSSAWIPIRARVDAVLQDAIPEFELIYTLPNEGIPNSGNAINMLLDNTIDFVHSSRPASSGEHMRAFEQGYTLKEVIVALEAIAVVTHPDLDIPGLTLAQLKGIYTGKITNWQEVGGPNLKIVPYSLSPSESSIAEYFDSSVMDNLPFGNNVNFAPTTTNAVQQVGKNQGAIYFSSAHEVIGQCSVKPIAIGRSADRLVSLAKQPLVTPDRCPDRRNQLDMKAVQKDKNGYPILQPLYAIVKQDDTIDGEAGEAYVDLLLTDRGQQLIQKAGFIPIRCLSHKSDRLASCSSVASNLNYPFKQDKNPFAESNSP